MMANPKQSAEDIFERALDLPAGERSAYLDQAFRDSPALRDTVMHLLADYGEMGDFLHAPALPAPQPESVAPNAVIAHYRIVREIGSGGMGTVYEAEDTRLRRRVALKFLPEEFAADFQWMQRFRVEARAASALSHPNICTIYEVNESGGRQFLAMELLEGQTLQQAIGGKPLPLGNAIELAGQIAAALDAAHARGIVHRDIKPANIFITRQRQIKILDFGVAKLTALPGGADDTTLAHRTQTGIVVGSIGYMAPEQLRGELVDPRCDVFAFGCVLYEMLSGRRAFRGGDSASIIAAILEREPEPLAADPALERVLRTCLAKSPADRFHSAGDAARALAWAAEREPSLPAHASRSMPKGRLLPAAIAVLAVAALAVAVWLRPRPAPPPEITRFQIFAPPGSSLPLGTPAPSPDGRTLAFTVRGPDGVVRLAVRRLDSTELRLLPGTENAKHPFWSPDGRSLGFAAVSDLKRIDLAGGTPRILASTPGPWQGSWGQPGSQSGVILFQPESKDVAQIPADGGTATPAVTTDPKKGELRAIFPVFLSDGKRFLALVLHADGSGDVELGSLGSMERTVVVSRVLSAPMLAPTPDGRTWLLYLRDSALMAQEFDERTGTVRGSPNLLLDRIGHLGTSVHRVSAGVSPQGVLAYQALAWNSATGGLVWFDRSGKRLSQLPPESTGFGPSLSPDGRLLAIQRGSDAGADVWLVDLARQAATRFTLPKDGVTTRAIRFPLWSPDGERLAYGCAGGGVCVKDANGIGRQLQLSSQPAITPLAWSPDGGQILYREDATNRLAWLRLDGQPAAPFPLEIDGMISGVHFSPDGKYLAFASSESGREEVYVEAIPPGVGKWQVSVDGGEQPTWRRDGRELFFLAPDAKMMAVDIGAGQQFSPGIPHALFQSQATASQFVRNYDVTPDGQRFIVALATSDLADQPITVVLNWWAALDRK